MANYVFAYSGGNGVAADEAARNAQMAKWGQWFGRLGPAVVDGGAPTGTAKTVGPGGSVSDGGSRGLTGYSIISADNLDSAASISAWRPRCYPPAPDLGITCLPRDERVQDHPRAASVGKERHRVVAPDTSIHAADANLARLTERRASRAKR